MTRTWLLACALPLAACGGDDTPTAPTAPAKISTAPDLAGKADGALTARPLGRLAGTEAHTVTADDGPVAWRTATFTGTRFRVRATSPDGSVDPIILVRGPLPADPQAVYAWNDDAAPDAFDAEVEVTAPGFGAFEIVVGTYGQLQLGQTTAGQLAVDFECLEGCTQPTLPLAALLSQFDAAAVDGALTEALPALFADPTMAAAVRQQISGFFAGEADVFPVLPIAALSSAQPLLERAGDPAVEAPGPRSFELTALLTEACTVDRAARAPVHPALPAELTRGGWPDYTLDDCTVQRQRAFAEVLNNLALDNGSAVVHGPTRYESVEDVFVALIDAGHHVVVENNRYFANFLGLNYGEASLVAPVWIDTGLPLAGGGTLPIPAPHSHHSVTVTGPLVNAHIEYYMGVSGGVSFRSAENLSVPWVGERTAYTYDSAVDPQGVVARMTLAARLRRVWTERGQGLPALGYGQLGVCNDSTAVLELDAEGTVSIYPLAHSPTQAAPTDQVDTLLAQLPYDLGAPDPSALDRITRTLPYVGEPLPQLEALLGQAAAR